MRESPECLKSSSLRGKLLTVWPRPTLGDGSSRDIKAVWPTLVFSEASSRPSGGMEMKNVNSKCTRSLNNWGRGGDFAILQNREYRKQKLTLVCDWEKLLGPRSQSRSVPSDKSDPASRQPASLDTQIGTDLKIFQKNNRRFA